MRKTLTFAAAAATLAIALPAMAQPAGGSAGAEAAPSTGAGAATSSGASAAPSTGAQSAPSAGAPASSTAPATTLSVGLPVKDKTGVVIGSIAELKPEGASQTATVKMGDQSFAIGAESFVVQNGAAVINATQAELKAMIAKAGNPG